MLERLLQGCVPISTNFDTTVPTLFRRCGKILCCTCDVNSLQQTFVFKHTLFRYSAFALAPSLQYYTSAGTTYLAPSTIQPCTHTHAAHLWVGTLASFLHLIIVSFLKYLYLHNYTLIAHADTNPHHHDLHSLALSADTASLHAHTHAHTPTHHALHAYIAISASGQLLVLRTPKHPLARYINHFQVLALFRGAQVST